MFAEWESGYREMLEDCVGGVLRKGDFGWLSFLQHHFLFGPHLVHLELCGTRPICFVNSANIDSGLVCKRPWHILGMV